MWRCSQVVRKIEKIFKKQFPFTNVAFNYNCCQRDTEAVDRATERKRWGEGDFFAKGGWGRSFRGF